MSTKRPSVTVNSDLIQKYVGSDFDAVALLDSRIGAIEAIVASIPDLDALLALLPSFSALLTGDLYVEKPLMNSTVDFDSEGYPETTLGAFLAAVALDVQSTLAVDRGTLVVADTATQTTPINHTGGTPTELTNDGLGALTDATYAPTGITQFFNSGTDKLDFDTGYTLGDIITLRVDVDVTTTASNQEVDLQLTLGEGTDDEITKLISTKFFPTAAEHNMVAEITFCLSNQDYLDAAGNIEINSASNATVKVNSFEAFINAKN